MTELSDGEFEELNFDGEVIDVEDNTAGFVLVIVRANPANRSVWAEGFINETLVCTASAADQDLAGARSTPTQSFTMPVPRGARFRINASTQDPTYVRVFRIRA